MFAPRLILPLMLFAAVACAPPHRDLPPDQIDKLDALAKVMDVQATVSDPQFKKVGQATYTDADWAAFADMASRLQVTSRKAKQFSKGPDFDKLADDLHSKAEQLGTIVTTKDAHATSDAIASIHATCRECHHKFK